MVERLRAAGWLPQRWDGAAMNRMAELVVGAAIFLVAWLLTMWGWGFWLGVLFGWVPSLILAYLAAPLWRLLLGSGVVAGVSLMIVRML